MSQHHTYRSGLQQGRLTPSSGDRTDTLAPGESAERSRGHAPKRDQEGEGGLHHHRHGYSPTHHYLDRKSERRQRMQPGVDPASSPRLISSYSRTSLIQPSVIRLLCPARG